MHPAHPPLPCHAAPFEPLQNAKAQACLLNNCFKGAPQEVQHVTLAADIHLSILQGASLVDNNPIYVILCR